MEQPERDLYDQALAYEAYVGPEAANKTPFRGLSAGEKGKFAAIVNALRAGASGADGSTLLSTAPNSFALPTVDPVTGERLRAASPEGGAFGDMDLAERAGLAAKSDTAGSDTSGAVKQGAPVRGK